MDKRGPLNDLCFKPVGGMERVFDPCCGAQERLKKHGCPDCHFCQFCSDSRCNACQGEGKRPNLGLKRKLSMHEQIQLFNAINARCQS